MPTPEPTQARRRRRFLRTLLRRFTIAAFLFAAIAATAVFHFSRPHRIAAFAEEMLENITGAEVHLGSASFSLDGTVMLHDLELRVPGLEGEGGELFQADTALLKLDPSEAIRGRFVASEMLILRPTLSLTEIEPDRFNYEQLRRERSVSRESIPSLPRIYVRDGRVRYGEVYDGQYHAVGHLHVAGQLTPDPRQPALYRFELAPQPEDYAAGTGDRATGLAAVVHPTVSGRFNLENFDVAVQLNDFAFVDPHRNMLPRQIRRWWDLFEPSGSLPNIRFDYDPLTGPTATVDVEGVSLSIPQLSDVDYRARMSDVSGTFHFDAEQIRVENLVGEIEGLQYRINGIIDGYSAESAFQLSVDTRPFRMPEEPRFMPAMPLDVQEVFNHITPVGWMRVSLVLRRDEAGDRIDYDGSATILSGRELVAELMRDPRWRQAEEPLDPQDPRFSSRGQYDRFPYPIHDAAGLVTFNSEKIEVKQLTGKTHGGGRVTINGTIAPPSGEAVADLRISATNLRFDEVLYDALRERQQRIVDMFFDKAEYERLREAGHYVTADDRDAAEERARELRRALDEAAADSPERADLQAEIAEVDAALARPVFELGGRFNLELHLHRKLMNDQPGGIETRIELDGLNVVFEHFPYPVEVVAGDLVINDEGLTFSNVQADGLAGGQATLGGRVDIHRDADRRRAVPDLHLMAEGFPIDGLLEDVVPQPHDRWLRELNPAGTIAIDGRIIENTDPQVRMPIGFDIDILFADATLAPGEGRYPLDSVNGRLRLTPNQLEIAEFTGRNGDGRLDLTGQANFAEDQPATLTISGEGADLRFEDDVLDLIGPAVGDGDSLEQFWAKHQPAGRFDVSFAYQTRDDEDPYYRLQLRPESLAFDYDNRRVELVDVTGAVDLVPDSIGLEKLTGTFDEEQRFAVDGSLVLGETPHARLSLDLEGHGLSPTLQRLAPETIAELLRTAEFDGDYRLDAPLVDLTLRDNGEHEARLQATLHLENVQFDFGLPVTEFEGTVALDLRHDENHPWPALDLGLHARRLLAAGRPVESLVMTMRNPPGSSSVVIDKLTGKLAGGSLDGRGSVDLERGRFQLQFAVDDAQLHRIMTGKVRPQLARVDRETGDVVISSTPPEESTASAELIEPLGDGEATSDDAVNGLVSLSLAVEGGWKTDTAVRGRGELNVREANLRGLPLAMGLLQMTHLTLPADQTFERAASTYYIRGDEVVFETVQIDAPAMRIGGSGSLNYRSRDLDLTLTTSNPAGLNLGPLTTIIDGFRDQLVTLRVTGTTADPQIQVRQLDGLSQAWRDVLGE